MHSTGREAVLEFSIGTSLRVPQPDHAQARTHSDASSDFGAKLGLQNDADSTPNPEAAAFGERATQPLLNQSVSAVRVANEQAGMGASALIELYELGLRAGHHLSHVSHAFMADALQCSSIMSVGEDAAICPESAAETLTHAAMQASVAMGFVGLDATQLSASSLDNEASPIVREWAGYLGSQWPERRWQLLKRPDGLELLVRDYHLTHEEQENLVAALHARIPSSTQPPERIWLNGQVVWQAETAINHAMTGGHYGR